MQQQPMIISPVGLVVQGDSVVSLQIDELFWPALKGLEGFSHVIALWWFSRCDSGECREVLTTDVPYAGGPPTLGVFATRSPMRPNPIAVSVAEIVSVDAAAGRVDVGYLDAEDGTPLIDLKPYTPSLDRVEDPGVPGWCETWPRSLEASASFDWEQVFAQET